MIVNVKGAKQHVSHLKGMTFAITIIKDAGDLRAAYEKTLWNTKILLSTISALNKKAAVGMEQWRSRKHNRVSMGVYGRIYLKQSCAENTRISSYWCNHCK